MASDTRRQLPVLIGLVLVLVALSWWQFGGASPATPPVGAKAARPAATRGRPAAGAVATAPAEVLTRGVGLERLDADRPAPEESGRDPFRSGAEAPGDDDSSSPPAPVAPPPVVPVGPPAAVVPTVPPITVKFIGVVSRRDVGKVAILSDGKNVYYGREGEIVDGRWRIVSIGEESLQIEYVDGRGRQTVRMTG
jgi:hypothetical protein